MKKTYKDYAYDILEQNKSGLHINIIAEKLKNEFPDISTEKLAQKIGTAISNDIKKNKNSSRFRHVKGKRNQNKKGIYRIKRERKTSDKKIVEAIRKSDRSYVEKIDKEKDRYTGKAGEYAVISELLFRQYNASLTSVDDGIDIIATKDKYTYYIQAKTGYYKNNKLQAKINLSQFEKHDSYRTFYIIVFRYREHGRYQNEYFIINSVELRKYLGDEVIKKEKLSTNVVIYISEDGFLLNNKYNLKESLNNFDQIKP